MDNSNPSGPPGNGPQQFPNDSGYFSRQEVQDMLDRAQWRIRQIYENRPVLCRTLQDSFREALERCNDRYIDFNKVIDDELSMEIFFLAEYNTNRLTDGQWEVNAEEEALGPIPNDPASLPLHSEVVPEDLNREFPNIPQGPRAATVSPSSARTTPAVTAPFPKAKGKATKGRGKAAKGKDKAADVKGKEGYDKFGDAPSMLLPFPNGNITLAEICAFLPQSIKSWDLIDRLIWNGVVTVTLVTMINNMRTMPRGKVISSTIYRMMKGPMDQRAKTDPAYKNWTVGRHQNITKPSSYDENSVSVAGFRPPNSYRGSTTVPNIPFRDLANGVKQWPSGDDALDLTRCVRYCVDNSEEEWVYPDEFEDLLTHLDDFGPATVRPEHTDAESVNRNTKPTALNSAKETYKRKRDDRGRLIEKDQAIQSTDDQGTANEDVASDGEEDIETTANPKPKPVVYPTLRKPLMPKKASTKRKRSSANEEPLIKKRPKPSAKATGKRPVQQPVPEDELPAPKRQLRSTKAASKVPTPQPPAPKKNSKKRRREPTPSSDEDTSDEETPSPKRKRTAAKPRVKNSGRQPPSKKNPPAPKKSKPRAKAPSKRPVPKQNAVRPRHQREITLADLEPDSEPESEPEAPKSLAKQQDVGDKTYFDSDYDSDAYRDSEPQKMAKTTVVRKSSRKKRVVASYDINAAFEALDEEEEDDA